MDETQQRIGNYAVVRRLGAGGMGVVYLATDLRLGRHVALKTLKRDEAGELDRQRFLREARAAAAVEHDNLVPIYDVGEAADGTPFLVMPLLQGEPLDARLRREPVAPVELLLRVARDVADGLAAAHARGLVHRDVKPANIWLEGDPGGAVRRCKVLDFGLARAVASDDPTLTGSGAVLGSPAFMAPEQAQGKPVDHRADLFALGATLYRAAAGQLPFPGDSTMAVLWAVVHENPPPATARNPDLPRELADLIARLLSKDPDRRPASAAEVSKAARALQDRLAARAERPSDSFPRLQPFAVELAHSDTDLDPPAARPARPARARWPWALLAALLLLVPGALWLSGARGGKRPGGPKADEAATAADTPSEEPKPKAVARDGPAVAADPDRAAALWVLSVGGCVNVDDRFEATRSADALPTGPFRLAMVTLTENASVTDDGLRVLAGCRHLTGVGLSGTRTGDAGLAHLRGCDKLMYVYLKGTQVTSAGLAHLTGCADLLELDVSYTPVDDAGMAHARRFAKLTHLGVEKTKVTAAGVADFARAVPECDIAWDMGVSRPAADPDRVAALWVLSVNGTLSVNGDFADVNGPSQLPKESFQLTRVWTAAPEGNGLVALSGCRHLARCTALTTLDLSKSAAGDEGLGHLTGCPKLRELDLGETQVSDAGLAHCRSWPKLEKLKLDKTRVRGPGLAVLLDCPALTQIDLAGTGVEDQHLSALKDCGQLAFVTLRNTKVGDPGMEFVAGIKNLRWIDLDGTGTTDDGVARLAGCRELRFVYLKGTGVSDAGVLRLAVLPALEVLDVRGTKVTPNGVAALAKALPNCTIEYDGGTIPPSKK